MILQKMMDLVNKVYYPHHQMRGYTVKLREDLFEQAMNEFQASVQIIPFEMYGAIKMKNVVFIPRKER